MLISDSVSKVPLIGPAYVNKLEKLGIVSVRDLLYHLPSRYQDYSVVSKIRELQEGETVTVQGKVLEMKNQFTKRGFILQKAVIEDETGKIEALWFNQRFLPQAIHKNDLVNLSGKVKNHRLESPEYEVLRGPAIHTGRLVPVYPETAGISSKWLRSRIKKLLDEINSSRLEIQEYLDAGPRNENGLMGLKEAIFQVHFPDNLYLAARAKERLAFDELLVSQLESRRRRKEWQNQTVGNKFKIVEIREKLKVFVDQLPFGLTSAQKKVIDEIFQDLARPIPMNRLLQGDVGSGKTVVAALAMLASYLNGYQSVLMAPTEILANQHYDTLLKLFQPLKIGVGIATSSNKDYKDRDVIIGTHALLSSKLDLKRLGLVIIDESHRFGVEQRATLIAKGTNPHVLTMTATPIPRTVALTLYGDLDVSVIDQMPVGRIPVKTWVVPNQKRQAAYDWIIKQQTQTFVVCPLIEQSEVETMKEVKAVKAEFDRLGKEIFTKSRLGLLHGRLASKAKKDVIKKFRDGKLDVLVATPVIEVGMDIPTANIMLIEAADRFGLAQLHQLRGRVGRGDQQSYCLLFTDNNQSVPRLRHLEKVSSGLELAEIDLKFRGPGQRFGTSQHGRWELKIADFSDLGLVERSNKLAQQIAANPTQFPLLLDTLKQSKINIANN